MNGASIERYDVIAATSRPLIHWAHLVQILLASTVDLNRLTGQKLDGVAVGDQLGLDGSDELYCKETVWAPLKADSRQFTMTKLLPGQDIYFAVRAINCEGKGEFSELYGPLTTGSERPPAWPVLPVRLLEVTETSARFTYTLPYSYGAPFVEAVAALERLGGPLAAEELHPETQEPHQHIARREWPLQLQAPAIEPQRVGDGKWIPGTTEAIKRCFRIEGADGQYGQWHGHAPTLTNPTNFTREGSVEGLIPGNSYRITWRTRTKEGWTELAEPVEFLTDSTVPDVPEPLTIFTA